ncbi:hypothetical protein Glove_81g84 [Diversispora epigaea]|uniref:DUF4218 domain-containing protein n=1 Tax=Diversispora epigaea TaxID=1348612 RepID=A0A397J7Z1_9GLOM|nr:hypothetical protein Glove_81g84 [Diversispora epigaea]
MNIIKKSIVELEQDMKAMAERLGLMVSIYGLKEKINYQSTNSELDINCAITEFVPCDIKYRGKEFLSSHMKFQTPRSKFHQRLFNNNVESVQKFETMVKSLIKQQIISNEDLPQINNMTVLYLARTNITKKCKMSRKKSILNISSFLSPWTLSVPITLSSIAHIASFLFLAYPMQYQEYTIPHHSTYLQVAQERLRDMLINIERTYGPEFIISNIHLSMHISECIRDYGSVYSFWLFPYERLNGYISSYPNSNRQIKPELI